MTYPEYLTACSVMDKVHEIDKAIEYTETVPLSTECYTAVVDMLKYEKHGLIENFKHLECCPTEEEMVEFSKIDKEFVMGRDGSVQAPEGIKLDTLDTFAVHC